MVDATLSTKPQEASSETLPTTITTRQYKDLLKRITQLRRNSDNILDNWIEYSSPITALSGITLTNPTFTDTSASLDALTVTGAASLSILTVSATTTFANPVVISHGSAPTNTADTLYNVSGDLYWNGSLIAGGAVGNWSSAGGDVYRLTGNIGIGTTSPLAKLSVKGEGTGTGLLAQFTDSADSPKVTILDNGNVGIGTTSPTSKLELYNAGDTTLTITGNTASGNASMIDFKRAYGSVISQIKSESEIANDRGNLRFYTTGASGLSEAMRITSTGNVGIGTTSPISRLHVSGGDIYLDQPYAVGFANAQNIRDNSNGGLHVQSLYDLDLQSGAMGTGEIAFYTGSNTDFVNQRMVIDKTGNVGIGTSTPGYPLTVNSSGNDFIFVNSAAGVSGIQFYGGNGSGAGTISTYNDGSLRIGNGINAGTTNLVINTLGNIGIGTTSPAVKLDIYTGDNNIAGVAVEGSSGRSLLTPYALYLGSGLTGVYGGYYIAGSGGDMTFGNNGAGDQIFKFNSVERMRLTNAGNIGIGTTTPGVKLDVHNGIIRSEGADQSNLGIQINNYASGGRRYELVSGIRNIGQTGFSVYDATAGTSRLVIDASGNVGIGTTTPGYKLTVSGDVYASSFIDDGVTIGAPDYVFDDPAYDHLSIEDIETFIEENDHLPWLTPRGSGAMSLSARINEVLEALENLFLKVFELVDWNKEQDARNSALEAELEAQNVRIEYLESVIVDLIGEPVSTTETKSKTQTSAPTEQDGERHTGNQANEKDEDVQEKTKTSSSGGLITDQTVNDNPELIESVPTNNNAESLQTVESTGETMDVSAASKVDVQSKNTTTTTILTPGDDVVDSTNTKAETVTPVQASTEHD